MPKKGPIERFHLLLRRPINRRDQERLVNKTPSIIANNCTGGVISHDLGLRFYSSTINLYFMFPDYLRFLERLPHYLALDPSSMRQIESLDSTGCPCGQLEDVRLVFPTTRLLRLHETSGSTGLRESIWITCS